MLDFYSTVLSKKIFKEKFYVYRTDSINNYYSVLF